MFNTIQFSIAIPGNLECPIQKQSSKFDFILNSTTELRIENFPFQVREREREVELKSASEFSGCVSA